MQSVTAGSGASAAGLQPGDIITAIDGQPISSVATLQRTVYGRAPGSTVALTTQRYGSQRSATVTLQEAPAEKVASAAATDAPARGSAAPKLGIDFQAVTPQLAQQLQIAAPAQGLLVTSVDPSGPSAGLLYQGDVIRSVLSSAGARPVRGTADLQATNGVISLLVATKDVQRVVNVQLAAR